MEELNKLMFEKGYKPILVFKYGIKGATHEQVETLKIEKKGEYGYLTNRYDVIVLVDPKSDFYEENVEMLNPFFTGNQDITIV